jgi:SAM-dependent methyltransferase
VSGDCRLCGGRTFEIGERGDLALARCSACGFVSGFPVERPSAKEQYAHYYDAPQPPSPSDRYSEWLRHAEDLVGKGRLLEIGAGSGGFVRAALARGWDVTATEISDSAVELLRRTRARIFAGDLPDARFPDGAFDFVASLEVVEHLPDPRAHLAEIARVLRPGGLLLATTPSFAGLSRRMLGLRWRVLDPEHLGYFDPRTLRRALRDAGFRDVSVRSRTLDVTTWRATAGAAAPARFDPQAAATLRDRVESSPLLRVAKDCVNGALAVTGLGDSLLAWARR